MLSESNPLGYTALILKSNGSHAQCALHMLQMFLHNTCNGCNLVTSDTMLHNSSLHLATLQTGHILTAAWLLYLQCATLHLSLKVTGFRTYLKVDNHFFLTELGYHFKGYLQSVQFHYKTTHQWRGAMPPTSPWSPTDPSYSTRPFSLISRNALPIILKKGRTLAGRRID